MEEMTASEMLRDVCDAPGGLDPRPEQMLAKLGWRLAGSCGHYTFISSDATRGMCDLFGRLADKIDAELAQARELSLLAGAELWAKANGWPDFKEGEDFGAWLARCTYKKPVDDCNEPVQFGDDIELHYRGGGVDKGCFQEVAINKGPVSILSFVGVSHARDYRYDSECDILKRPVPEALGADGLPIKEGETVWDVYGRGPIVVKSIGGFDYDDGPIVWDADNEYTMPYLLTHERPVLGADLKPIVEGETVYPIDGEWIGIPLEVSGIESPVSVKVYLSAGKSWTTFHADSLTHTPPDTLERLRDDMYRTAEEWREADSVSIPDMNHWADRLAALIERKGGE